MTEVFIFRLVERNTENDAIFTVLEMKSEKLEV